jgi:hypothetical protein
VHRLTDQIFKTRERWREEEKEKEAKLLIASLICMK